MLVGLHISYAPCLASVFLNFLSLFFAIFLCRHKKVKGS